MQCGTSRRAYDVWGVCGADVHVTPAPAPAFIPTVFVPVATFTPAIAIAVPASPRLRHHHRHPARNVEMETERRCGTERYRVSSFFVCAIAPVFVFALVLAPVPTLVIALLLTRPSSPSYSLQFCLGLLVPPKWGWMGASDSGVWFRAAVVRKASSPSSSSSAPSASPSLPVLHSPSPTLSHFLALQIIPVLPRPPPPRAADSEVGSMASPESGI
ncbi:hypothetical protein B0H13DRAFT_2677197 [Mycena leptocephala]|nr:hypothetical protein B0H13DRAFT_2677197 [Mycena leptocephala]